MNKNILKRFSHISTIVFLSMAIVASNASVIILSNYEQNALSFPDLKPSDVDRYYELTNNIIPQLKETVKQQLAIVEDYKKELDYWTKVRNDADNWFKNANIEIDKYNKKIQSIDDEYWSKYWWMDYYTIGGFNPDNEHNVWIFEEQFQKLSIDTDNAKAAYDACLAKFKPLIEDKTTEVSDVTRERSEWLMKIDGMNNDWSKIHKASIFTYFWLSCYWDYPGHGQQTVLNEITRQINVATELCKTLATKRDTLVGQRDALKAQRTTDSTPLKNTYDNLLTQKQQKEKDRDLYYRAYKQYKGDLPVHAANISDFQAQIATMDSNSVDYMLNQKNFSDGEEKIKYYEPLYNAANSTYQNSYNQLEIFETELAEINAAVEARKNLSNFITTTNLGVVAGDTLNADDMSDIFLQNAINHFNPSANLDWTQLLITKSASSATITAITNSTKYTGSIVVTYTYRADLQELIATSALGQIDGDTLNDSMLQSAINKKNPSAHIDWNQVSITYHSRNAATVQANPDSTKYVGDASITFAYRAKLSTLITSTNVGEIIGATLSGSNANDKILQDAVDEFNPFASLVWNDLIISNKTSTSATITAAQYSTRFTGSVTITYGYRTDISKLITAPALKTIVGGSNVIANYTLQPVINRFNPEAANLDWNDLVVSDRTSTGAVISAKPSSKKYAGSFSVTYTYLPITNRTLGTFNSTTDSVVRTEELQSAINKANPSVSINWNELVCTSKNLTFATFYPNADSKTYSGDSLGFSYEFITQLAAFIPNKSLGTLPCAPEPNRNANPFNPNSTPEVMREFIKKSNPLISNLDWSQIDISITSRYSGNQKNLNSYTGSTCRLTAKNSYKTVLGTVDINFTYVVDLTQLFYNIDVGHVCIMPGDSGTYLIRDVNATPVSGDRLDLFLFRTYVEHWNENIRTGQSLQWGELQFSWLSWAGFKLEAKPNSKVYSGTVIFTFVGHLDESFPEHYAVVKWPFLRLTVPLPPSDGNDGIRVELPSGATW